MDFTVWYIQYTGGCLGGYLGLGPYYGYSYSYSYGGVASEGGAIALTQANVFQLNSVVDRGASRYTVSRYIISRYTVRCKYTDAKGALS